ncbi:hypothetical protein KDR40_001607 [Salmonella enterica subsp. enterica serovar Saintpaul]|nr:hypothetical protein [Salmonella enterica subsp. enterica serovar Saintpaul]
MKNQAKTQHSVFKFIRAAIPVTVLSAIQYAVISTLLVVGKIDLQWSELATSLPLCIIAIFSTAFGKSFCLTDEITRLLKAGKNHEN